LTFQIISDIQLFPLSGQSEAHARWSTLVDATVRQDENSGCGCIPHWLH